MEYLTLGDLSVLYTALACPAVHVDLSVIKQYAIKVISKMLAFDPTRSFFRFSNNRPCSICLMTHPGERKHRHNGTFTSLPFLCEYLPYFPNKMEYSRTFHSSANDETMTEMTISANNGKPLDRWCIELYYACNNAVGPTKSVCVCVDFYPSPTQPRNFLRFFMETSAGANIEDKFKEALCLPSDVTRTVAHIVPLQRVSWIDGYSKITTDLPKEWYEFWSASGIRAISTFSNELVTFNGFGTVDPEWQWKMLSFKTEWKIPMPVS